MGSVRAGLLVTTPNMLGHDNRPTDDFHLQTFAQELFANEFTYDGIVGHSFGGDVTPALLLLLSTPQGQNNGKTKAALILVDPGIEFGDHRSGIGWIRRVVRERDTTRPQC